MSNKAILMLIYDFLLGTEVDGQYVNEKLEKLILFRSPD